MSNAKHHFTTEFMPFENGIILSMKGELDASSSLVAINILENMVESGVNHLILNCSQLTYISSAGIGAILSIYHLALVKNTLLTLLGLQPPVRSMLDALGADNLLRITYSMEEAMAPAEVSCLA